MMENYDKKKQSVADIIALQQEMQSIYGIPRSAYGIAQKMYRMGVLSATLQVKYTFTYIFTLTHIFVYYEINRHYKINQTLIKLKLEMGL